MFKSIASIACVLVDRLREQQEHGAEQRDLRAVDALGGDHRQRRRRTRRRRRPSAAASRHCAVADEHDRRAHAEQPQVAAATPADRGRRRSDRSAPSAHVQLGTARAATSPAGADAPARASTTSRSSTSAIPRRATSPRTQASASSRERWAGRSTGSAAAAPIVSRGCRPSAPCQCGTAAPDGCAGPTRPAALGLDEPAPDRVARQLDAVAHAELGQHVLAVALDGLAR